VTTELALYQTASSIRKELPSIDLQYEYQQKLSALKQYAKDKQFYVAQLEAEVAMAQTLPQAMKNGDVKAERNGKGQPKYVFTRGVNIHGGTVNSWRQVAEVPARERSKYYGTEERPTRSGLLRWWDSQTVNTDEKVQSHGVVTNLSELVGVQEFGCIYADPPWAYSNKATRASVGGNSKSAYKSTMTVEEICAEPVSQLAADKSHLHLWICSS